MLETFNHWFSGLERNFGHQSIINVLTREQLISERHLQFPTQKFQPAQMTCSQIKTHAFDRFIMLTHVHVYEHKHIRKSHTTCIHIYEHVHTQYVYTNRQTVCTHSHTCMKTHPRARSHVYVNAYMHVHIYAEARLSMKLKAEAQQERSNLYNSARITTIECTIPSLTCTVNDIAID